MPTWLDMVKMEMENMDLASCPESASEELDNSTEKVCATLTDNPDLKKLHVLKLQWLRKAMELEVQARFSTSSTERKELMLEIEQLGRKAQLVEQIFYVSLRDTYDLWDKDCLHMRKGWKVVTHDGTSHGGPDIRDILGGLFGGGR